MRNPPPTNLERVRDTVALHVQAYTLRAVARQIGLSPSGLDKFLAGGTPYAKSRKKLYDWWDRERGTIPSQLTSSTVSHALRALILDLPPEIRDSALDDLVETLRGVYDQHSEACPPWMGELLHTYRDPAPEDAWEALERARAEHPVTHERPDGPSGREPEEETAQRLEPAAGE